MSLNLTDHDQGLIPMGSTVNTNKVVVPKVTMDRIVMHWSAGNGKVSDLEKKHYHFIVAADGTVVPGTNPVESNIPPLKSGSYAAHTWKLNSNSIGVAVSAMAGATERPWSPGRHPITKDQVEALASLVASLSIMYGIKVTPETVLTHAEVQPTLGVTQKAKWDITWLPGMDKPQDPIKVGNILRAMITKELR